LSELIRICADTTQFGPGQNYFPKINGENQNQLLNGEQYLQLDGNSEEMGKRKSKRKAPTAKKAVQPLDTQFNCPFCNHERSCEVKLDRERNVGFISCRVCLEDFQTSINYLSEAIDVYSDWIDACEQANQ